MMYQPQHEITISPYPFGGGDSPFVFGAKCVCSWLWMPNTWERTSAAMREHYVAEDMAIRELP